MRRRAVRSGPQGDPVAGVVEAPAAAAPDVSRLLHLQRSAGNAAVARLATHHPRASLARQPADAPPAPAATTAPPAASPVAGLAARVGSPVGLRAAFAANPALAPQVIAFFAGGGEDAALNGLLASAFPPADVAPADGSPGGEAGAEKNPTDPNLPLPAALTGDKKLAKGQMKWTLDPVNHNSARADVDFTPDATKVEAKNVSYVQTVLNKVGTGLAYAGGTAADPAKNKSTFEPFEEATSKKRVDHLVASENDPFYGAEWDQANKKWKREGASVAVGSSKKGGVSKTASMNDTPGIGWGREGKGDAEISFETVPLVLETREPLGSLKWGFKIKDSANSPIELTGAQDADCVDSPSADWTATLDKFYAAKYEILDDFDIGKADLKPDHTTKLDAIVTKMKGNAALKAQLGGAADLTGGDKVNQALSLKRAQAARDYLVGKGVEAARLEVQSYGSDWARVEAEKGTAEGKNRRVQVWLH